MTLRTILALWALGGALLIWLTWDLNIAGVYGVVAALGYFGLLMWVLNRT